MMFILQDPSFIYTPISMYLYSFYSAYAPYFISDNPVFIIMQYLDSLIFTTNTWSIFEDSIVLPSYLYQATIACYNFIYQPLYSLFFLFLFFFNITIVYVSVNITRIEKELNNIEDNMIFFILLGLFIFYILGFYLYIYSNMFIMFYLFLYIIIFFIILIMCIPFSLLFTYGFFIPYYLRGASNITFLVYEIFLDYINIISFFLRIGVQFIRIFLILLTIYTYNELYIELNTVVLATLDFKNNDAFYSLCIVVSIHWLLEFIHIIIIFITQLTTFLLMLIWLFQFLFTVFSSTHLEQFFFLKRNL